MRLLQSHTHQITDERNRRGRVFSYLRTRYGKNLLGLLKPQPIPQKEGIPASFYGNYKNEQKKEKSHIAQN